MKTIGLLGGMSWESTADYYRLLNQRVNARLGDLHSAKIVMVSVDFQPLEMLMRQGHWAECGMILSNSACSIEKAGADFLLICTNTMHKLEPVISKAVSIPILHIADATAEEIKKNNIKTVGLLGTRFTMEEDFYRGRLSTHHDLHVITPPADDRRRIHDIIFDELCRGIVREKSRYQYLEIIERMVQQGAEGIIAGCTEIGMLITQNNTSIPLFDTTSIHVNQAVCLALAEDLTPDN